MPVLSLLPNCHPSDTVKCRVVTGLDWLRNRLACIGQHSASIGLTERWPVVDRMLHSRATEGQYSDLQTLRMKMMTLMMLLTIMVLAIMLLMMTLVRNQCPMT